MRSSARQLSEMLKRFGARLTCAGCFSSRFAMPAAAIDSSIDGAGPGHFLPRAVHAQLAAHRIARQREMCGVIAFVARGFERHGRELEARHARVVRLQVHRALAAPRGFFTSAWTSRLLTEYSRNFSFSPFASPSTAMRGHVPVTWKLPLRLPPEFGSQSASEATSKSASRSSVLPPLPVTATALLPERRLQRAGDDLLGIQRERAAARERPAAQRAVEAFQVELRVRTLLA